MVFCLGLLVACGAGFLLVKAAGDFAHNLKYHEYGWAISSLAVVLTCVLVISVGLLLMRLR